MMIVDAKGGTSMVTISNVNQSNGVIHVVDTVLMPARDTDTGCLAFQAKWIPFRVKKTRQIKNLELRSDSIGTEKALVPNRPRER